MSKFKSFMEKLKKNIFIYLVVWLIIAILLVAPITYTFTNARNAGITWLEGCTLHLVDNILKFPITEISEQNYINDFIKGMEYYSIFYFALVIYAIYKTLPKSAYDKIEHGSSDWCKPGEQYSVLSKKEGLLLAKENYLPLNKSRKHKCTYSWTVLVVVNQLHIQNQMHIQC